MDEDHLEERLRAAYYSAERFGDYGSLMQKRASAMRAALTAIAYGGAGDGNSEYARMACTLAHAAIDNDESIMMETTRRMLNGEGT